MKKILTITIAASALLSIASCQKEELANIESKPTEALRIITGSFTNDETKTTLGTDNVTPQWSAGDVIRLLDNTSYEDIVLTSSNIDSDDASKITFTTSLTGTMLYAVYPASATTMTSCSDGNITFTIPSIQEGSFGSANICVASGNGSTENTIYFCNATAVVEMTVATGVVGAEFNAVNNIAGNMTITMGAKGVINGTSTASLSSNKIIVSGTKSPTDSKFYLAVAPVDAGTVTVTCNTTTMSGSIGKGTKTLAMDKIYAMNLSTMTIGTSFNIAGRHGIKNGQEYVIVKISDTQFQKWATENLAVTESGKGNWKSTGHIIGDYFQWGASYAGYNISTASDQKPTNLVIYNSFTSKGTGGTDNTITFKTGKDTGFTVANAPYSDGSNFTKYNTDGIKMTLELSDDVANIVLGGSWRIPSNSDYNSLKTKAYWAWDATDMGYYVFTPGIGTSGTAGGRANISDGDDKTKALLFFPAFTSATSTAFETEGKGRYWVNKQGNVTSGQYFNFTSTSIATPGSNYFSRGKGCPIRPILD